MSANGHFGLRLPRVAVNIFMLTAMAFLVSAKRLSLNVLRNVPFWIAKRRVLAPETGHIAAQNVPFHRMAWHIQETRMHADDF